MNADIWIKADLQMDFGEKIKTYFKEAEVYRIQGLFDEALKKYRSVEGLIKANHGIRNKKALLKKVSEKIDSIDNKLKKRKNTVKMPKVSQDAQDLMKEMFTFDDPDIKGSSSLGGAVALARFGQYDKAIEELTRLLEYDSLRMEAAKNILWCWYQQNYVEYGISLFQKWQKTKFLNPDELETVRVYFQDLLNQNGVDEELDGIGSRKTIEPDSAVTEDEIIDVSAVRFILTCGPRKGEKVDLDVSFQSGNYIRIIIPRKEKQLVKSIKPGDMLKEIIFYSPMAIFSGTGFVSSIKEIEAGPKRGDYSIEIKIIRIAS